jgi:hypothetical protein
MELPEFGQLQYATDRYLDQHAHSDEAYVKVTNVINKFDFMVTGHSSCAESPQ